MKCHLEREYVEIVIPPLAVSQSAVANRMQRMHEANDCSEKCGQRFRHRRQDGEFAHLAEAERLARNRLDNMVEDLPHHRDQPTPTLHRHTGGHMSTMTDQELRRCARAELDQYIDEIWAEVNRLLGGGTRDAWISEIADGVAANHKAVTDVGLTLDHKDLCRVVKGAITLRGDGPVTFRGPKLSS